MECPSVDRAPRVLSFQVRTLTVSLFNLVSRDILSRSLGALRRDNRTSSFAPMITSKELFSAMMNWRRATAWPLVAGSILTVLSRWVRTRSRSRIWWTALCTVISESPVDLAMMDVDEAP